MPHPRSFHLVLPRYAGPPLPEPPRAWYPGIRAHATRCTSERTARSDGTVRAFVLHATAGSSARGAMSVMFAHRASWHWLVPDEDEPEHGRFVWACAPERRAAWHVRNDRSHPDVQHGARFVNYWSLGAEIVNAQTADDAFSHWQVEQTAALVRYAWSKYPELVDVVSHAKLDPERRNDPGPRFPWEAFTELVLAGMPTRAPSRVARIGRAASRRAAAVRATARDDGGPAIAPDPLRVVSPTGATIPCDPRVVDGVTVVEARPLIEALGFTVKYETDGDAPTLRVRERRSAARGDGLRTDASSAPATAASSTDDAQVARATRTRQRTLDAIPDTLDFRDRMFEPTLVEVPRRRPLEAYLRHRVPVLDQRTEGACTGFGLATVANYLLRTRRADRDDRGVSPRMLYQMAKRYDEWAGEHYEGSSARGAMKGWHKHGVCSDAHWPFTSSTSDLDLTPERARSAAERPLGAYLRVNHRDLVAMHAAIAEVGILFATGTVHAGWEEVGADGAIELRDGALGGHAFAIVGYDARGFWLQNSWGENWGRGGFAQITYDDWLQHGTDVWVARLGAPIALTRSSSTARGIAPSAAGTRGYVFDDLRPHVISVGNDGALRTSGTYGTSRRDVERIFREDFPRVTSEWGTDRPKRLLLYAHGGLVGEQVYPVGFVWRTDFWSTVRNVLQDAQRRRRPEGILDSTKDFMLDRLDDMLEPLARMLGGRASWKEMKENALLASARPHGGAAAAAELVAELARTDRHTRAGAAPLEVHLVGHSAGAVFLAPLVQLLTGPGSDEYGLTIASCTLWAPACTVQLFDETYRPAITSGRIARFAVYTLTDRAENDDDCANVYHKSLLYLVSHAFEDQPRVPFTKGTPILGLERSIADDRALRALLGTAPCEWVRAPNERASTRLDASGARRHGDFDDDPATVRSTLARILGRGPGDEVIAPRPQLARTAEGKRDVRAGLGIVTRSGVVV